MKNNIFIIFFVCNFFLIKLEASLSNEDKFLLDQRISMLEHQIYLDRKSQVSSALLLLNLTEDSSWIDVQKVYKEINSEKNENMKDDPLLIDKAYLILREFFLGQKESSK